MHDHLIAALENQMAFHSIESHLLKKAREFYGVGFAPENLSTAQMNAISARLQQSTSFQAAADSTVSFLKKQMEKLEKKESRTARRLSWRKEAPGSENANALGEILIEWIRNEKYLTGGPDIGKDKILQLDVLRRFWSNVFGLYSYKKALLKDMPLVTEEVSS